MVQGGATAAEDLKHRPGVESARSRSGTRPDPRDKHRHRRDYRELLAAHLQHHDVLQQHHPALHHPELPVDHRQVAERVLPYKDRYQGEIPRAHHTVPLPQAHFRERGVHPGHGPTHLQREHRGDHGLRGNAQVQQGDRLQTGLRVHSRPAELREQLRGGHQNRLQDLPDEHRSKTRGAVRWGELHGVCGDRKCN